MIKRFNALTGTVKWSREELVNCYIPVMPSLNKISYISS